MDDGKEFTQVYRPSRNITHYYHANADAFGGRLELPINTTVPVLAPTSLPVAGGYASAVHDNFEIGGIISIGRAFSEVSGSFEPSTQSFHTLVRAGIERVNINDQLLADKIVVEITTEHPIDSLYPSVSFGQTQFVNLRTPTCGLNPVLRLDLFDDPEGKKYPTRSNFYNPKMRAYAKEQSKKLADLSSPLAKKAPIFERLFNWHSKDEGPNSDEKINERGNVILSVVDVITVDNTHGSCPDTIAGHILAIPNLGRVFLGELIVDHDSFDLNLLRLDMGSNANGTTSGPHGSANGTTTGGL